MPIKQVNVVIAKNEVAGDGQRVIAVRTYLPSSPELWMSCSPAQDIPKRRDRLGEVVPHGLRKWVSVINLHALPAYTDGASSLFDVEDPCDAATLIWWMAQLQAPAGPELDWCTVINPALGQLAPGALWGLWRRPASFIFGGGFAQPLDPIEQFGTLPPYIDGVVCPGNGTLMVSAGVDGEASPQPAWQRCLLNIRAPSPEGDALSDIFSEETPRRPAALMPARHFNAEGGSVEVVIDYPPDPIGFTTTAVTMTVAALFVPD